MDTAPKRKTLKGSKKIKLESLTMLKKTAMVSLKNKIITSKHKQYPNKTNTENPNKLIASDSFFGNTMANSYCKVANGFKINVAEENKIYIPKSSVEKSLVSIKIDA